MMDSLIEEIFKFNTFNQIFDYSITNWLSFCLRGVTATICYVYIIKNCNIFDLVWSNFFDENRAKIKKVKKILNYNNTIGIHPSYNTYNNPAQFTKEKQKIEDAFGIKIECGRQHYLRFNVPTTWQIWEDNRMKWDSTLSYADKEGFRCGVCYEL